MAWFRGLKLKLLVILLVSSAALATALYVGFDIKDKQSKTISLLMDQRIPISESIGQAESNMNAIARYLDSALIEEGESRQRRIDKVEFSIKSLFEHLGKLKTLKLSAKSFEQIDEIEKRAIAIEPLSKETILKLRKNKPEAELAAKQIILKKVLPTLREMTSSFEILKKIFAERNLEFNKEAKDNAETAARTMQLVAVLSTLFLWAFGLSIAFSVSKKLQIVTSQVDSSSEEVAKSAQEVSQDTKARVESGYSLCKDTASKMPEVTHSAQQILESSEQILRASQEQNSGIRQISISVESLNKSTQSNAASSEESAASSATLFDLSQNLKGQVGQLFQIVEGKNEGKPAPVHVASTLSAKAKVLSLKKEKKEAAPAPLQRVASDSAPAKSDKGSWDSL